MNEGWLELESDPGLFTLLLKDIGVQGVQVEEIYDLQAKLEGPVYGYIFLFKWIEERRSRRKFTLDEDNYVTDEDLINNIFFAKQIINNSCATHALLSVLLNCNKINLGTTLTQLKAFTKNMNAEDKGLAIGNMPDLARAHNSHARPEPYRMPEKQQGIAVRTAEAFHFVSYVPIDGRLFELDGLQPYPVDHGPWGESEDWTEHFRRVISDRLGMASNGGSEPYHDIRFNLMAVVPDKRQIFEQKLKTLKTNRQIILETLQQILDAKMVTVANPEDDISHDPFNNLKITSSAQLLKEETTKDDNFISVDCSNISAQVDAALQQPVRTSARLRAKGSAYSNAFANTNSSNTPNTETESINSMDSDSVFHKMPVKVIDREETDSDIEIMDDVSDDLSQAHSIEKKQLQTVQNSDVKFHISVSDEKEGSVMPKTLALTDVTKPLSIQTKFGNLPPGPGTGSSTDTASEFGGSCLSSPVCSIGQPSPHVGNTTMTNVKSSPDCIKIKQEATTLKTEIGDKKGTEEVAKHLNFKTEVGKKEIKSESGITTVVGVKYESPEGGGSGKKRKRNKFGGHHGFTPKDLVQLLNNVESEITTCENSLKEERDKYDKYKIDDSRRTHNYDQFICTFLSMLAEQGHLAKLVEEQTVRKKSVSSVTSNTKKIIKSKPKTKRR